MTLVRNVATGRIFPCIWDDCDRSGHTEFAAVVHADDRPCARGLPCLHCNGDGCTLTHVFCSERHRGFWTNSHKSYANLASGSKGLFVPRPR